MSRTIRFHKFGAAEVLKCEEHEVAAPAPGEVQVRVEAIAISWYDVLWRQNLAPTQARLPAGIGHEMAGIVTAVGAGVDDLSVGDKVASFPAQSANDYPTYGELILMPRSALTRYPDILTPVQACTHYTPLLIAYFAYVDLARVKPGQSVLITDASHCAGPSFVQLGKALGAKVIAATKESEERNYLLGLGADHVIVTEEQDLLMQINKITDNRGVDAVFDGLGGPQMSVLGDVLAPRGSLVLYGLQGGNQTLSQLQRHASTTWAVIHVAMRLDAIFERENFHFQRQQYLVGSQLVDFAQGALNGLNVLVNAQLRFASEVTDAMHKKLNILLKTCAGWQPSLIATLQPI